MEKTFLPPSDGINSSVNTIEASIEIARKKRRRKKRCNAPVSKPISTRKSDRILLSKVRTASSLKSKVSFSESSCIKMLSVPELTQKKATASITSTIGTNVSKKYSSLLFSTNSMVSRSETPMFNGPRDVDSMTSEAVLSDTFLSEYENRSNNSQIKLQSEVDKEWEALDQRISSRDSSQHSQQDIPEMEVEKEWEALSQQISCRDYGQNSIQEIPDMEMQYQSEITFNQVIHSSAHESNFELPPSDYNSTRTGNQSCVNDFRDSIHERIVTQNLNISLLTKQNHQIATQLQSLERYVREKMEAADEYMKTKLTKIEEASWAVLKALSDIKGVESDEPSRKQRVSEPVRSQSDMEPIRSQSDKEPIRSQRDKEPIRSQRAKEPIRSQRDKEPNRIERYNEPVRPQRHLEPARTEQCNGPIGPQQQKEPIRIERRNELIETRRDNEAIRAHQVKQLKSWKELVMPKIPISCDFNLVILNIALEGADYMKQFVSEASNVVTLNAYNCRYSVRTVLTALFSIKLLGKYRWSTRTFSFNNKPTFSSLTNVLRAIAGVLTNYMSEHDVRREVKAFFMDML
ncbi:probable serine/threonine-protein kinase kinX isoform X2 [Bradysia coprophila]|uniref:probable serine/threonine-protein kinase kinX isoform X2 n=1 Tax=Bradysia coprophila TaxID=38358 RepID=UPI00187DC7D1|nr:probable serine/threonine-protein kinase kinX isoform X2 [Bradysia coprophila]